MSYRFPVLAPLGLFLLTLSVIIGYLIYKPGYGSGPQGITEMTLGISISFAGCIASLICGTILLFIKERPLGIGLFTVVPPVFLVILCISGVIRL